MCLPPRLTGAAFMLALFAVSGTAAGQPDVATRTQPVATGVEYRYYGNAATPMHVVLIDRATRERELRVLADEQGRTAHFNTHRVTQFAETSVPPAIVAINGSFWSGPGCIRVTQGACEGESTTPNGALVLNGDVRVAATGAEWVMGFAAAGSRLNLRLFRGADFGRPENQPYLHYAIGTNWCVLHTTGGVTSECPNHPDPDRPRSAVGYSSEQVVLLSSAQSLEGWQRGANVSDLAWFFRLFGVTDGLLLDGGNSAQLYVRGVGSPVNPLPLTGGYLPFRSARHVSNAVGLVTGRNCRVVEDSCLDGIDNDCDGLADCDDLSCTGQACLYCSIGSNCPEGTACSPSSHRCEPRVSVDAGTPLDAGSQSDASIDVVAADVAASRDVAPPPRDTVTDAGTPPGCSAPQLRCGAACTDPRTDPANCGTCGRVCSLPNASSACTAATCVVTACNAGFGNCDGSATNGCERRLTDDNANCGACGNACPSGRVCRGVSCVDPCGAIMCSACERCAGGACVPLADGTACPAEGHRCTANVCRAGRCTHDPLPRECNPPVCGPSPSGCFDCGSCPSGPCMGGRCTSCAGCERWDGSRCAPLPNDCGSRTCGMSPSGCYTCGSCTGACSDGRCVVCGDRACTASAERCPSACGADCCARWEGFDGPRACVMLSRDGSTTYRGDALSLLLSSPGADSFAACVSGGSLTLTQSSATWPLGNYPASAYVQFAGLRPGAAMTFHMSYACRTGGHVVAVTGSTGGEQTPTCPGGLVPQSLALSTVAGSDGTWSATIGLGRANDTVTIDYLAVDQP